MSIAFMNSHIAYQFGKFYLDPAKRKLLCGDQSVTLPPKSFDCIVYLIERRDQAVTREELIGAVWGHDDVSDSLIGQTILMARRALNETGDNPQVIETVRGFGYHWNLPVESVVVSPPKSPQAETSSQESLSVHGSSRRWLGIAALVVVLLTGGVLYLWRDAGPGELDNSTFRADEGDIALLLPVEVDSESGERDAWMRLGVMELVNSRLRAAGQPMVPSENVLTLARGLEAEPGKEDFEALAEATGARLLLVARAESSGSRWRVTLRSLNGTTPPVSALGEGEDVLEAARTAADYVALSVGLTPPPEPDAMPGVALLTQRINAALLASRRDTAHELIESADSELRNHPEIRLQQARIDIYEGRFDVAETTLKSLLVEFPAESDPVFRARALNGLGMIRQIHGDLVGTGSLLEEAIDLLLHTNRKDLLGGILVNLGSIVARRGDFETAVAYYARAREPLEASGDVLGLAQLDNNLGVVEGNSGRFIEALAYFQSAAERIAPMHSLEFELYFLANIIHSHLSLLDPQAALAIEPRLNELLAQTENSGIALHANTAKARLLFANGRMTEAELLLDRILKETEVHDDPADAWSGAILRRARHDAREGRWTEAMRLAAEVIESKPDPDNPAWADRLGLAWLTLLRSELATDNLAQAIETTEKLSEWAARNESSAAAFYASLARAELAAAEGQVVDARAAFERALNLANTTGQTPALLREVVEAYVIWLLSEKSDKPADPERATMVFERIARFADRDFGTAVLQLRLYHAGGAPSAWRAALTRARSLAGERRIPEKLLSPPRSEYALIDS